MANPKGNPQNLKPFKKGDPRTVAAAKKSKRPPSIATALKNILATDKTLTPEILAKACIKHALEGSPAHMKLALEYIDGKVKDEVHMTGEMTNYNLDKKEYMKARKRMLDSDEC